MTTGELVNRLGVRVDPHPGAVIVRSGLTPRQELEARRQELLDLLERTPVSEPLHAQCAARIGELNSTLVALKAPRWRGQ